LSRNKEGFGVTAVVIGDGLAGSRREDGATTAELVVDVESNLATAIVASNIVTACDKGDGSTTAHGLSVVKGNSATAIGLSSSIGARVVNALASGVVGTAIVLGEIVG